MGKPMIPFDEFNKICKLMAVVPQSEGELQRNYYKRIEELGVTRSRATLQNIERAKKGCSSAEEAYESYKKISSERNERRKEAREAEKEKNKQIEFSDDELKSSVSVPAVCPQEEIPFSDPFPEEFDVWQSDLYSFISNRDNCVKIDDGMITLFLSDFEYYFRRGYGNG